MGLWALGVLLHVVFCRSMDCWQGIMTEELCCDSSYPTGNPECWDGTYTYERCCPHAKLTENCWQGFITEELCCDPAYPKGNPECWDDTYTYEKCCPKSSSSVKVTDFNCWQGALTEEFCCDASYPAGNPACWDGTYTYETCCPRQAVYGKQHGLQRDVDCWNGNLDLEKRCCNPFVQDAFCLEAGISYYDCCKRDPDLVASMAALLREQKPDLEFPFQQGPPICKINGGYSDQYLCHFLGQGEDLLRHQLDPGCWAGGYTASYCCDFGDPSCWDRYHTFERCCLGVNPQVSLLQEFYRCEHCMSMFQQPRLTCEDLFDCVTHGGTLFAMSQEGGLGWEADVLCLPTMNSNNTDMRAIVFATGRFTAMQWAKDHHGKSVAKQLQFLRGNDASVSEALLLLGPWLVFNLVPRTFGRRATKVLIPSERTKAIDGARVIGTAAVVLLHLNTGTVMNDPVLNKRRLIWFYTQRFVDIFAVLSILVTKSESGLLGSMDALGRKLSRQLPLIIIMMRVRMWAAGLCLSHESCREMKASGWSADRLVGWLTFSPRTIDGQWYFSMDLKIWLVFRGVDMLNQRFPREVVIVGMAVLCFCMAVSQPSFDGNRYLKIDENLYYKFWAYRLPMSLLVYAVSLRSHQRLRPWAFRHPWLWSSTAVALCSLGWLGCWPQVPAGEVPGLPWRPLCAEDGMVFFWGGVFFHVGVTMLCLQPPPMPGLVTWMVRRLSPLTLGILTLHPGMFNLLKRCQHVASPWFLLVTNHLYKHHWDDFPRWLGLVVWTAGVMIVVLAAQVLLWTVQQPWENLWSRCPKFVRRVLVLAYFLLFVWKECWQNSLESLAPK